jgi:nucleoside-diphosphate-sugar epimerase
MDKSVITVTGGTGYIASWIVSDLLQEGHKVRITVRNKSDFLKYQHLLDLEGKTEGELSVFEADLLSPGSFDAAVKGADYVMHTASPFFLDDGGDPQKNLVDPAVKGTKNVLEAVNRSASVKRVVLTSSIAAIYGDSREMNDRGLASLDETIWNESSSLRRNAYSYSKTEAEKAAWEMVKKQAEWDLVTIHPGFVLGPSLTKRIDSTSIGTLLRILRGEIKSGAPLIEAISPGDLSFATTPSTSDFEASIQIDFDTLMRSGTLKTGTFVIDNGKDLIPHKGLNLWNYTGGGFGYWIKKEDIEDEPPMDGYPNRTNVLIAHSVFRESNTYRSQAGSGLNDIYQNCFKPSGSTVAPCSAVGEVNPSCCNGTPTSALNSDGNCN